jgi:hypothetical protein
LTLPVEEGETRCEDNMRAKDALSLLYGDAELIEAAGPAVLRLKLLEATYMAQDRRLTADMREAARQAAEDLRQLIRMRPCVSLIDHAAKKAVAEPAGPPATPLRIARAGHA